MYVMNGTYDGLSNRSYKIGWYLVNTESIVKIHKTIKLIKRQWLVWYHPLSTYAKFSEKRNFLPPDTHASVRTKWTIPFHMMATLTFKELMYRKYSN